MTGADLPFKLPRHLIDPDAIMVCRRLQEAGFVTYLVGGCVRDILLGRTPKDFDIGTEALPGEVRKLFRNSRLIGRRFKLVHIHFGAKILEVATFRGGEATEDDGADWEQDGPDDLLIRRANNFGNPEQDAESRDFTINGLFYDPIAERVIDYVNGYPDVQARLLRTIGSASVRFREDPVRILRLIKFAARLGAHVDPEALVAVGEVAADIHRCSVPRVTEEFYRLAECGHAEAAWRLMAQTGVLAVVAPEMAEFADRSPDACFAALRWLDLLGRAHGTLARAFVLTLLHYAPVWDAIVASELPPGAAWGDAAEEWFRPIGARMHVPVRHRARMRGLWSLLGRFLAEPSSRKRRLRLSSGDRTSLPQALTLLRVHHRLHGGCEAAYEMWRGVATRADMPWVPISNPSDGRDPAPDPAPRSRSRRRRRGGGRGRPGASEARAG